MTAALTVNKKPLGNVTRKKILHIVLKDGIFIFITILFSMFFWYCISICVFFFFSKCMHFLYCYLLFCFSCKDLVYTFVSNFVLLQQVKACFYSVILSIITKIREEVFLLMIVDSTRATCANFHQ